MEADKIRNLNLLPPLPGSFSWEKYGSFWYEGENTYYYTCIHDDTKMPGYRRVLAQNYFCDQIVLEALQEMTDYMEEHDNDTHFYQKESFWRNALKYAGRTVVAADFYPLFHELEEGKIVFHTCDVFHSLPNVECFYDLHERRPVIRPQNGDGNPTFLQFLFDDDLLEQIIAQRQYVDGTAPDVYCEMVRMNEYLATRHSVNCVYANGMKVKSMYDKQFHAHRILTYRGGQLICQDFGYLFSPPREYGAPVKLTHYTSEFEVDLQKLALPSDVVTDPLPETVAPKHPLHEQLTANIPVGTAYCFYKVAMNSSDGEYCNDLVSSVYLSREELPRIASVGEFFDKYCAHGEIDVLASRIIIGEGEYQPIPESLLYMVERISIFDLKKIPGFRCEEETHHYDVDFLHRYSQKSHSVKGADTRKLLAQKILSQIPDNTCYTYADVTVSGSRTPKSAVIPDHYSSEWEVLELTLLRRARFRNPDDDIFTVTVFNASVGKGISNKARMPDELIPLVMEYGPHDLALEFGHLQGKKTFYISACSITLDDYKQRQMDRVERYEDRSNSAAARSSQLFQQSHKMIEHIPPGQPILVGHHSEAHHRRDLDRSWNKLGASVKEQEKAGYYANRADSAKYNSAISSDDPDALDELKDKLEKLKQKQEHMKAANKYVRKHGTFKGYPGISDEKAAEVDAALDDPNNIWGKIPYPSFKLTNNNANIRRIEGRIRELESLQENPITGWDFDGGTVVADEDVNRLQIFFDEIPPKEFRQRLHNRYSFNFSKANGNAWQRKLNRQAVYAAQNALKEFAELQGPGDSEEPQSA